MLDRHRSQADYLKRSGKNVGQRMMLQNFPFCSHTSMYWKSRESDDLIGYASADLDQERFIVWISGGRRPQSSQEEI